MLTALRCHPALEDPFGGKLVVTFAESLDLKSCYMLDSKVKQVVIEQVDIPRLALVAPEAGT
jgi:hypothetical protein